MEGMMKNSVRVILFTVEWFVELEKIYTKIRLFWHLEVTAPAGIMLTQIFNILRLTN